MDGDRRGDEMFEGLDENISVLIDEHDRNTTGRMRHRNSKLQKWEWTRVDMGAGAAGDD